MDLLVGLDDLVHGVGIHLECDANACALGAGALEDLGARFAEDAQGHCADVLSKAIARGTERLDHVRTGEGVVGQEELARGRPLRTVGHGMEHGIRRVVVPRVRSLRALASAVLLVGLAVGLTVGGATGCMTGCNGADAQGRGRGGHGGGQGPGGHGDGPQTAMKVVVTQLRPERLERWYRASGTLTAVRSAELVAVEPGIIEKLDAEEGDTVKVGDVLARLDGRELALQASAAKLQLDNLERELQRLESVQGGAISVEEIDKQRYAVAEARAAAKLSKVQAKQTVVRAPFSGTIVERHVDVGNLATTATPLFSLADLSALELELHIPERDAASVQKDTLVEIELVDGTTFNAKVFRKAPIVDAVTGTVKFTVRAQDRPDTAVPGAFARARVLIAARDGVPSLEREAVFEIEGVPHVYVVADGKARRREVKTGLEGSGRIEITSGLEADDLVVAEGKGGVTEGMPLAPVHREDVDDSGAGSAPPSPAAGS